MRQRNTSEAACGSRAFGMTPPPRAKGVCMVEALESRVLPAGDGLQATYWDSASSAYASPLNFSGPGIQRTDAKIGFNWGLGSPAAGIEADTFSVRWRGQIAIATTGTYRFYARADNGVKLWVNGALLVNGWNGNAGRELSGTVSLTGGRRYAIRMESYDLAGSASAQLRWSGPGIAKTLVPTSVLYRSTPGFRTTSVVSPNLSGLAIWNSAFGDQRGAGTLIDSRHVIFATHYTVPLGATLRWPSGDTATLSALVGIPGADITVGTLDHALPARNRPLPIIQYSGAGWVTNQFGQVKSAQIRYSAAEVTWRTLLVSGDSGHPIVAVTGSGTTGVVALAHYADSGTPLWTIRSQIAAAKQ